MAAISCNSVYTWPGETNDRVEPQVRINLEKFERESIKNFHVYIIRVRYTKYFGISLAL